MKKLLGLFISIIALFFILWFSKYILEFIKLLAIIDNTEFGIPLWLDILIDSIAGIITTILIRTMCDVLPVFNKETRGIIETIISIVIGFIIALVAHMFMKYWIIIVSAIGINVMGLILYFIISKVRKKHKTKSNGE